MFDALQSVSKTPLEEQQYRASPEHKKTKNYVEFIKHAKLNTIGRNVKIADISDNLDVSRFVQIEERDKLRMDRYKLALLELQSDL